MTKIKEPIDNDKVVTEWKFLKEIESYFWVSADTIKAMLKELEDANGDTQKLILTEQFNLWFIEWMKESAKQLEKFFEENVWESIQDFKEIDPEATVIDTVQETEPKDEKWNL